MTEEKYNFIDRVTNRILEIEKDIIEFKSDVASGDMKLIGPVSDKGEILANITLAYRHLEDARMRIGKVVQVYDGRTSAYKR